MQWNIFQLRSENVPFIHCGKIHSSLNTLLLAQCEYSLHSLINATSHVSLSCVCMHLFFMQVSFEGPLLRVEGRQ